jgi:hypothetical protein
MKPPTPPSAVTSSFRRRGRFAGWELAAWVILGLAPGRARADGAFPNSQGLLLPADRPNELALATNFGIVLSEDAGQTWTYSCEQASNGSAAGQYQIGPPPRDRVFAMSDTALIYTDDRACGWSKAQGMLAGKAPFDYFPDPSNADRVWAVRGPDTAVSSYTVVESTDGGATFGVVRFTAAAGDLITGVELARSDPHTAYVSLRSGSSFIPKLAVTSNGGTTWNTRDLSTQFASSSIRIVSVDPTTAAKIFLRVSTTTSTASSDGIALSLDGGATFVTPAPLTVPDGVLTSFVRLPSGTLLVGGVHVVTDMIYRSSDGGLTFAGTNAPTVVLALGQREGHVYLASSNDPATPGSYAVGESTDEGMSWHALMSFDQIQAISACAKATCQQDCTMKANLGIWDVAVCSANPAPLPVDGGARDAATGADARDDGSARAGADAGATPSTSSGCHCRTGARDDRAPVGGAVLVGGALALAWARRRRQRR